MMGMVDEGTRELLKEAFPELLTATGDISEKFDDINTNMETMSEDRIPDAADSLKEKMNPELAHAAEYTAGWANAVDGVNKGLDKLDGRHVAASIDIQGIVPGSGGATQRQHGGPVTAGEPYVVGEDGPELFIPASSGNIMPNGATGGSVTTWTGDINVSGAGDPNATAAAVIQKLQDRGILPRTAVR